MIISKSAPMINRKIITKEKIAKTRRIPINKTLRFAIVTIMSATPPKTEPGTKSNYQTNHPLTFNAIAICSNPHPNSTAYPIFININIKLRASSYMIH